MSAPVLLSLINNFRKNDHFISFHNDFNKLDNTGAQTLDSVNHMTLKLL